MFNIIAHRTLLDYCRLYPQAANALKQWYAELQGREFTTFNELKAVYGSVSIVADDRVVFNIMGNKYRLVVRMVFDYKTIQIKWFGTHAEYDKVDVTTVQYQKL
ncbi:type II toxin-antitoxin system HigB family toxin [Larkinella sp. GY13]|uniref:type II toxin-antitoxin system HigB family toxin n=1 Tax=Larkinella sp. GY13 TaxID=3453720 RepID=UPI003EEA1F55